MGRAGDALERAIEAEQRWLRLRAAIKDVLREAWALLTFPLRGRK